MSFRSSCLALILALSAGLPVLAAQTYRLQPIKLQRPFTPLIYLDWRPEPPVDAGPMPQFQSPIPLFSSLQLGDKPPMLIAADVSREAGVDRCTVYLDANWNGSLAGERAYPMGPVDLEGTKLWATEEIALALRHRTDSGDVVGRYAFRLATEPAAEVPCGPPCAMYIENGHTAVLDLDGTPVRLTVCDADGDGKLLVGRGAEGDRRGLSTDLTACPDPRSFVPLRSPLEFAGAYYELSIRPDGGQATIGPYRGPVTTLLVSGRDAAGNPAPVTGLEAVGNDAVVTRTAVDGPVTLLPGAYEISYALGDGAATPAYLFRVPGPLVLEPGAATSLSCGGPLSPQIGVTTTPEQDAWVLQVTASVRTQAGHLLSVAGSQEPRGEVTVLNLDGEVLARAHLTAGAAAVTLSGPRAGARYFCRVTFDTGAWQGLIGRQVPLTLKAPVR